METNALDPIRHQINAGERPEARMALVELLEAEPNNADAWALLAILLTHPAEQARCYREILRINPGDRQAQLWLEALGGVLALAPEPSGRSCPRCGGMVKVSPLPGSTGGRIVCPYCGYPVNPADAFESTEPAESDDGAPAFQILPMGDELDRSLKEVSLPDAGDKPEQPSREPEIPRPQVEQRGFLNGLLGRRRQSPKEPEAQDLLLGQAEIASAAGALSPELILRLAGGPLAPEERRTCPQCDAVVSRREARCPWCSTPLVDVEGE